MTLLSIQYLRGLAALMVVVLHLGPQWEHMGYAGYWPDWLAGGVDIFFVISGLVMWITTVERPVSPLTFYRRRVLRIAPLYWLLTSLVVAIMLIAPHVLQSARFGLGHTLSSYFFLPSASPGTGRIEPVLIPGWTLNYEMFFYLLFGLVLPLRPWQRLGAMAAILVALIALPAILPTGTGGTALAFYSSDIMLEFLLGMALGYQYTHRVLKISAPVAWVFLAAGSVAMVALPELTHGLPRVVEAGLPAMLMVTGALSLEQQGIFRQHVALRMLGDSSYSLYLSHPIVLSAVSQGWRKAGLADLAGGRWWFSIVAIAVAVACGLAVYRWIEQPLLRWLKDSPRRSTPAAVQPSVR